MTRFVKARGKIWIPSVPGQAGDEKPLNPYGKGKGAPRSWVAVVRPGKILFEMEGVQRRDAARRCAWRRTAAVADSFREARNAH